MRDDATAMLNSARRQVVRLQHSTSRYMVQLFTWTCQCAVMHSERVLKQAADAERTTNSLLLYFQHLHTVRGFTHTLHVT